MRSVVISLVAAFMPLSAVAVTLIESTTEGEMSKLWVEGTRARIESPDQPGYVLIDLGKGTMLVVNPQEKQIVDLSGQLHRTSDRKVAGPNVRLVKKGNGPRIAGYETQHYHLMADDQVCQDLYMSRKAYQDAKLEAYGKAFASYIMLPPFVDDPCDYATLSLDRFLAEGGLPMRVVEDGEVVDEIVRITTNAALPAGGFEPPAGYERVSMDAVMKENLREMEEQMRQMRENMSPEMQREMERMMRELGRGNE